MLDTLILIIIYHLLLTFYSFFETELALDFLYFIM